MKIRKIISIILIVVFVFTLPVSLFISNIGAQVLTEEGMSDVISDNLLFDDSLPQRLREVIWFQSWYSEDGMDPMQRMLITGIRNDQLVELFNLVLPMEHRENVRNALMGGLFDWLEGDATYPEISISLQPILDSVSGNANKVADWVVTNLKTPPCSAEREAKLTEGQYGDDLMAIISCKPSAENKQGVVDHLGPMLAAAISEADVPEKINLSEQLSGNFDEAQAVSMKTRLNMIRRVLPLVWLIPVLILGIALALVVRSWTDLFAWLGWPLLVVGLIGLAIAGRVVNPGVLLENAFMPPPAALPAPAAVIAMAVLGSILSGVGSAMQLQMAFLLFIGAALLIYRYQQTLTDFVRKAGTTIMDFLQIKEFETK